MDPVVRVVVGVRGDRDFPLADVKLPTHLVSDFNAMLDSATKLHPDATADDVVRAIWRYGTKAFRDAMANPVRAQGFLRSLPGPQKAVTPGGGTPGLQKASEVTPGQKAPEGGDVNAAQKESTSGAAGSGPATGGGTATGGSSAGGAGVSDGSQGTVADTGSSAGAGAGTGQ